MRFKHFIYCLLHAFYCIVIISDAIKLILLLLLLFYVLKLFKINKFIYLLKHPKRRTIKRESIKIISKP